MAEKAKRRSRPYHHGDLRRALLSHARALLEEGGPAALNLREIARRAGVTAPAAYHHFANRDALAAGLAELGFAEWASALEAGAGRPKNQLAQVGAAYVRFARTNPSLYKLMFGEGFRVASRGNKTVRALRQGAMSGLRARLRKRIGANAAPAASLFLWSLAHGLSLLMIDGQIAPGEGADATMAKVFRRAEVGLAPRKK
jgi:AcrR family transcriptional regulator